MLKAVCPGVSAIHIIICYFVTNVLAEISMNLRGDWISGSDFATNLKHIT